MHRQSGFLAEEIPKRHVDDTDEPPGELVHALVFAEGKGLPVPLDRSWVVAHEHGLDDVLEISVEDAACSARGLGPSLDPGVGLNSK
jgi:hypothetical protein